MPALLLALSGCSDGTTKTVAPGRTWLVASGDTQGWIVPCGCTSNQSGGLLRRGTLMRQLQAGGEVVYVDVGGAGAGTATYDQWKMQAILRGEESMGLAAHNIGLAEAQLGAKLIRQLREQRAAHWLSCNVRDESGELLGMPVCSVETATGLWCLVGVLSDSYQVDGIRIDPPREAILDVIHSAQTPATWIVLAYLPTDELRALARSLPEVDVVLGGPTIQSIAPERAGPTLLASATSKGKFVVQLQAERSSARSPIQWDGKVVELTDQFADDTVQQKNLQQFYAQLRSEDLPATETSFVSTARYPEGFRVAGTVACRDCHEDDCLAWDDSKHAAAWPSLTQTGADADPYCQQCHTTSYGLPGGFRSRETGSSRMNVGCESCHGPSHAHCEDTQIHTAYYQRASDQCLGCHDRENSPDFDYASYWERIVHGAAEDSSNEAGKSEPASIKQGDS